MLYDNYCGIYAYKDIITNKYVYVGQTTQSFKKRDGQHRTSSTNNLMNNKLKKYPMRFIMYPLIFFKKEKNINVDMLNQLEIFFIKILDTYNNGYNLSLGGKSYQMTLEHKKKISQANKGRVFSEEHKNKISKNHADLSGINHPMYGKYGKEAGNTKYMLWDSHVCQHDKRKNISKNLSKSFQLVYNTYRVPVGMFLDFVSVSIVSRLIEDFTNQEGGF